MIVSILVRSVSTLVTVFTWLIIIRAVLSFFQPSGYSKLFRDVVGTLDLLTEPLLAPIRNVVPLVGMFDLSPIIAIIVLQIIGSLLVQLLFAIH